MRKNTQSILLAIAMCLVAICTACNSRMRSTQVYEESNKTYIVIEEDTLVITDEMRDSVCIAREINTPDDGEKWLLQLDDDGQYSVLQKGNTYAIWYTDDFVMLGENKLYQISERKESDTPHGMKFTSYLGMTDGKHAFLTDDTICFSDGRRYSLKTEVSNDYNQEAQKESNVRMWYNAYINRYVLPLTDIYAIEYDKETADDDIDIRIVREEKELENENIYTSSTSGCDMTLTVEYPTGSSAADDTIRNMLLEKMRDDLFNPLYLDSKTIPVYTCHSADEFGVQAEKCIGLWEEIANKELEGNGHFTLRLWSNFRRIADNEDYTTYWLHSGQYTGGAHNLQYSYYMTYDKHNSRFVTLENMIRKEAIPMLKRAVMDKLCDIYIERNKMLESETKDSQLDSIRREAEETILANANGLGFSFSGKLTKKIKLSINSLPLPYFALLPEGIVVSYSQYKIDSYANGEYHVVVPYEKIPGALIYDYSNHTDEKKGIGHYIRRMK